MNVLIQPFVVLVLLVSLFFISRLTTNELFHFLRMFFKKDSTVFGLVSLVFFPGTVLHEFSHFLMAMVLMLPVHKIQILPEFEKNYIKLGKVLYEKKDFIRGLIVGIAPLFGALFFFWFLSAFRLFPSQNVFLTLGLGYIIFAVSSTMFSSKQDMVDIIYIVPVFIGVGVVIYLFNINLDFFLNNPVLMKQIQEFSSHVLFYLLFSLIVHGIVILVLKSLRRLLTK